LQRVQQRHEQRAMLVEKRGESEVDRDRESMERRGEGG
jgi:hypothetical protein